MRNRYLVCYDVSDPVRLVKTYKKMNGYGEPVQYSVFMCDLSARELIMMKEELGDLLNLDEDRVLIVDIGPAERQDKHIMTMGAAPARSKREASIIV